jgi:hypothetical protein
VPGVHTSGRIRESAKKVFTIIGGPANSLRRSAPMATVIAVQSRKTGPALQRVNGVEAEGLREFAGRLTMLRCNVNPKSPLIY